VSLEQRKEADFENWSMQATPVENLRAASSGDQESIVEWCLQ
jgi:hypothetical protein